MNNRIYYGSYGLLLKECSKNSNVANYFLSGVQSLGSDSSINQISHLQVGRGQAYDIQYIPPLHPVNIERILSNKDVFWLELGSNFLRTEPRNNLTYSNTYFLNKNVFGSSFNGWVSGQEATVKANNIPEYTLWLMMNSDDQGILESMSGNSGSVEDIVRFGRMVLKGLSYELDINGYFTETISLEGQDKTRIPNTSFTLNTIADLENPIVAPTLLRRKSVYNNLCVYPNIIDKLIKFNNFFNGQEIFGIKNIRVEASINYDNIHNGTILRDSKVNWHKTVNLPLDITCSFVITARKLPQVNLDEISSGLLAQDSIILESGDILLLEDDSYVSIQESSDQNQRICIVAGVPYDGQHKFFIWNLGSKNRLVSFSQTGGSTDGSIVEYTVSFQNLNNDFVTYTQVQVGDSILNPALFEQTTEKY